MDKGAAAGPRAIGCRRSRERCRTTEYPNVSGSNPPRENSPDEEYQRLLQRIRYLAEHPPLKGQWAIAVAVPSLTKRRRHYAAAGRRQWNECPLQSIQISRVCPVLSRRADSRCGCQAKTFGRAPVRLSRRDHHTGHPRAVTQAAPAPLGTSSVADRQPGRAGGRTGACPSNLTGRPNAGHVSG